MHKLTSFVLSLLLFLTFMVNTTSVTSASGLDIPPAGDMSTNGDQSSGSGGG